MLSTAPFYYCPSSSPCQIEIGLMLGLIWLGLGVIFLLLPRVSIALPAVALDERLTLTQAWRLSRGNSWRLALATLLCALPTLMIFAPLYWYFDWQPRASSVVLGTLTSLTEALLVTIAAT